jgi:hypothetical protein
MTQHDYVIANQSFPSTRTDLNNVLQAIVSNNSGTSAPSTTFANQIWYDSSANILYIRNEDNDANIPLLQFDQSADVAATLATVIDILDASGTNTAGTALTIRGGAGTGTGAGGAIIFQTADGGSSGSSVNAHATRVTITDDGVVGIGTTSPSNATLDVAGRGRFLQDAAATTGAIILRESSGGVGGHIQFVTNDNSGQRGFIAVDSSSNIQFGTSAERMRITSGGAIQIGSTNSGVAGSIDVSVGSTSSSGGITLFSPTNGTHSFAFADGTSGTDRFRGYVEYQHANDRMDFATAATARMTIDSTGQVAIGKTSASIATAGVHIAGNETADGSPAYIYSVKTFSGTRNVLLNYHSSTYVGGINMTNTSTSFPTSSDERLKKNIVDAPSAGDKIDAMQVRSFNWKADDSFQEYGLIAQELQSVYDLPVEQHDIEDTYTVDYSKLVPVLLKEIQDLRKRVATLENN